MEVEVSVEKDTSWTLEISPFVKLEMCLSCNNLPLTKLYVSFFSRMSRTVEAMNSASSLVRMEGSRFDKDFAFVLVLAGLVVILGTRMILLASVIVMSWTSSWLTGPPASALKGLLVSSNSWRKAMRLQDLLRGHFEVEAASKFIKTRW